MDYRFGTRSKTYKRKEVKEMKKLLVLCIALTFFASFALIGCGPSSPPPAAKEEAKPAPPPAPAPEKAAPAPEKPAEPEKAPAPAPEKK